MKRNGKIVPLRCHASCRTWTNIRVNGDARRRIVGEREHEIGHGGGGGAKKFGAGNIKPRTVFFLENLPEMKFFREIRNKGERYSQR